MLVSDPVRQVATGELPGLRPTDLTEMGVGLAGEGAGTRGRTDDPARPRTLVNR